MQNLLSTFKSKQAGILLDALQKANDEEFSRFVLENINAISAWLHSEEFEKEHLQEPFPPLLNPKFLELESSRYCANLAWNLNLPLNIAGGGGGERLKFIYISPHGVGAAAFVSYLFFCDLFCNPSWNMPLDSKERYIQNFIDISEGKYQYYGVNISEFNIKDLEKFCHLLGKDTPVIIGTRDSIGILKHCVGRNWDKHIINFNHEFNLSHDFRDYIRHITHKDMELNIDFKDLENSFTSTKILPFFRNITPVDCEEILPHNALETMERLATKFNFNPPKNKTYFQNYEFKGYLRYILPLVLYANEKDPIFSLEKSVEETPLDRENSFVFIINVNTEPNEDHKNIFKELSQDPISKNLGVYVKKEDLKRIDKEFYAKIKAYLSEFIAEIIRVTKEAEEKILKEKDVLAYLKKHKDISLQFKQMCDEELKYFKQNHPDLVNSWHYYKEFEKLCESFKEK
ncbi:DUF2972 domain-containing protein [Campylobacter vulpis]|uniref:DUF2972 domain-containing protein n=2 Tax=Campylobacter vulpis TaxID=1655500 RepID=UPI001BCC6E27|nr:DUF2972 domain-containing protein [Campylobacter vulpis]MBS4269034.1 DUF2972 domain-containing protein [Campylobacter vulpis]